MDDEKKWSKSLAVRVLLLECIMGWTAIAWATVWAWHHIG